MEKILFLFFSALIFMLVYFLFLVNGAGFVKIIIGLLFSVCLAYSLVLYFFAGTHGNDTKKEISSFFKYVIVDNIVDILKKFL